MYLAGLLSALSAGPWVQADTIVAEPARLMLQGQTEAVVSQGQLTIGLEAGAARLHFDPKGQSFQKVTAKIWSLEDRSDLLELPLTLKESGQFLADFKPANPIASRKYFLEMVAVSQDGTNYELKDYSFDWQLDATTSTTEWATTQASTTSETTSTSEETTSSHVEVKESSAATAIQEAAKGNLTIQHQSPGSGKFDVIVSNVSNSSGIRAVKLPVWTEENGQDDLR